MLKYFIVNEFVKKFLSLVSEKDSNENINEELERALEDVSSLFNIKKIDIVRFFEEYFSLDPVTWYYNKLGKPNKKTVHIDEIKESTTSGSVASSISAFNPEDTWKSIYPIKNVKNVKIKNQKRKNIQKRF
ncbi:MAG: hypothetical protein NZZ41_00405 [Candidatus Dojkabacteria bacterium]|nr:hypothetical protein [Candidatus Dojkabacteria bacterium]